MEEEKPLAGAIYQQILQRVLTLEIDPGSKISVEGLVRDLHVSHTPIREALHRLEIEGLVVRHHLRGFSATPLMSQEELSELYDLRLLLEPEAARRAATMRSKREIEGLADTVQEMVRVSEGLKGQEKNTAMALSDARFHDSIALCSGNRYIARSLVRLHMHLQIFRQGIHQELLRDATEEHLAIFHAIEENNGDESATIMRLHLETSRNRFLDVL